MNEPQAIPVPSSDGVTVVAHDHGGDGPPVLFCHATGFCGRYWDPICRRLADRWRCIAIDLRGHGDSVVPEGVGYDWPGMADDVLAVIDAPGAPDTRCQRSGTRWAGARSCSPSSPVPGRSPRPGCSSRS